MSTRYQDSRPWPARYSVFGGTPQGWAWRCPGLLFGLFLVPVFVLGMMTGILVPVRVLYGYKDAYTLQTFLWMFLPSSPGLVALAMYLVGRLELVDGLPGPRTKADAAAPMALPGEGAESGGMRSVEPARAPAPFRWSAMGVTFWTGVGLLGLAGLLMFLQVDEFDSVLGIKLGGRPFMGTYWNNWWFVFYAVLGAGVLTAAGGFLGFVVRLNRRSED
ncbi:MAG: hypothetical protein KGL53_06600 [Elusimicrobia bacterium]|nr:hypothetical protein [Elusimicrobiota bacterium]